MSHHNKKSMQSMPSTTPNLPFDINSIGQLLNNVDINSMSNTLNNIDLNQVVSMLSKALTQPVNNSSSGYIPNNSANSSANITSSNIPNNLPNNTSINNQTTEHLNPLTAFSKPNFNPINSSIQTPLSPVLPPNNPTVMILNSLKPLLPSDKCIVIDNMIQIYGIKTVIDKIFPPSVRIDNSNTKNNSDANKSKDQANNKPESEEKSVDKDI